MNRRVLLMGTIVAIVGLAFLLTGISPATQASNNVAWGWAPATTSAPATTCAPATCAPEVACAPATTCAPKRGCGLLARLRARKAAKKCCAPEPVCCEPQVTCVPEPVCCEPATTCAPKRGCGLLARLRARKAAKKCCAPAPVCCEVAPATTSAPVEMQIIEEAQDVPTEAAPETAPVEEAAPAVDATEAK